LQNSENQKLKIKNNQRLGAAFILGLASKENRLPVKNLSYAKNGGSFLIQI